MDKNWSFTVDVDGVYTCDVYEGHSHPFPDDDLIACGKFCSPDGTIQSIIYSLGEWEFFTEDAELQKDIKDTKMKYFIENAFFNEHIFSDEILYPKRKGMLYGMSKNIYGAVHIWKKTA